MILLNYRNIFSSFMKFITNYLLIASKCCFCFSRFYYRQFHPHYCRLICSVANYYSWGVLVHTLLCRSRLQKNSVPGLSKDHVIVHYGLRYLRANLVAAAMDHGYSKPFVIANYIHQA